MSSYAYSVLKKTNIMIKPGLTSFISLLQVPFSFRVCLLYTFYINNQYLIWNLHDKPLDLFRTIKNGHLF